ncbi:unnamed protein product [Blepharisma stoltei]|uniref:Polycystin cation channel PKD1/PKD2 domain-containing protein n=1 Tax=Blepharisma stoltei TaxID=1481888 RepID=A0AAU9IQ71_9CILI|nr:unnamed protein product [Blepharisma stoltei]
MSDENKSENEKPDNFIEIHDFNLKIPDSIKQIQLSESELQAIENKINRAEKDFEESLTSKPINVRHIYKSVTVSFLFIFLCIYTNSIERISWMSTLMQNHFERQPLIGSTAKSFEDIQTHFDLENYIRSVFLPGAFNHKYIDIYNYVIGVRFTLKIAKVVRNPFEEYKEAVWMVRENPDISPYQSSSGESDKELFPWRLTDDGGFNKAGGYVSYFLNMDLDQAMLKWRQIKPGWFGSPEFNSLVAEVLIHNTNLETTLNYYQVFEAKSSGYLSVSSGVLGIFPEMYETWSKFKIAIVLIGSIYVAGLIWQIYEVLDYLHWISIRLWVRLKWELSWSGFMNILSICLATTAVSLFIKIVLCNIGHYKLPITNEDDFDSLAEYAASYRALLRVISITVLLTCFKVFIACEEKFPSFGILFDTISAAKHDILYFWILTSFIIISISLMGNLGFGLELSDFSTLGYSALSLINLAFGKYDIKQLSIANIKLYSVFVIIFVFYIIFILINNFLAILLSTYINLRKKNYLLVEAKAMLLKQNSKIFLDKILSLILFRYKSTIVEDSIEYLRLSSIVTSDANQQNEINAKLKNLENFILKQNKVDFLQVFKYNIIQLSMLRKGTSLLTREKYLKNIKNCARIILTNKKKKEKLKSHLENLVNYNFYLLLNVVIAVIYIAIFLAMVGSRLKISESYYLSRAQYNSISNQKFVYKNLNQTFKAIKNEDSAYAFLQQVILPLFNSESVASQNFWIGESIARITLTRYDYSINDNDFSRKAVPFYLPLDLPVYKTDFIGNSTGIIYKYLEPEDSNTFSGIGGYKIDFIKGSNFTDLFLQIQNDQLIGKNTNKFIIEWILYNTNANIFLLNYLTFQNTVSGLLSISFSSNPIEMDIYESSSLTFGTEIAFYLISLYYLLRVGFQWYRILRELNQDRKDYYNGKYAVKRVLKIINGEISSEGPFEYVIRFLARKARNLFYWIHSIAFQLFRAWVVYMKQGIFKAMELVSVILSIIMRYYVFRIYTNEYISNFKLPAEDVNYYNGFEEISTHLNNYRIIVAVNAIFIFCKIIEFGKFTKHFGHFIDVINSAKLDLGFYLVIFWVILLSYSLTSYLLVGHMVPEFSSFSMSLFSSYIILIGQFNSFSMLSADSICGCIVFLSMILIFNLLLLNIFIAIIAAHYSTLKHRNDKENKSFFSKIIFVIHSRIKGKKYMDWQIMENKDSKINDIETEKILSNVESEINSKQYSLEEIPKRVNYLSTSYLSYLEEMVKFSSIKCDLIEHNNIIIEPATLQEVSILSDEEWLNACIYEKLRIWKRLLISHNVPEIMINTQEINRDFELSPQLINLWQKTSIKDKLSMWIGIFQFDEQEKIMLWNTMIFTTGCWWTNNEEQNKENQDKFWSNLTHAEKKKIIHETVSPLEKYIERYKAAKDPIEVLLKKEKILKDEKLLFWFSLWRDEFYKFSMFMNQNSSKEAEIIGYLMQEERIGSVFSLDKADVMLENMMDKKIYDFICESAVYQAESVGRNSSKDRIKETRQQIKNLKKYSAQLNHQIPALKKENKEMKKFIEENKENDY